MSPHVQTDGLRERKINNSATRVADAVGKGEFTWKEVAKHNTAASAWVIINGVVYDVTEWADRHPGGRELVLLHAGRECTDTFQSYHPFSNRADSLLKKFAIGKLVGPTEFPVYKPDSGFYKECAQRVGAYFRDNKINPKNPFAALWRMTLVFAVASVAYMGMNNLIPGNKFTQYVWGAIFGVCQALPLLHVMHDSSHASVSNSPTIWYAIGRGCMDWFAGGSMVSWLNQHVVGHHIYTNVAGADPDLPVNFKSDVRRIVERQVLQPIYKFQHIYLPPLYGVLGLKFRLQDVMETFVSLTNGPVRVNPHSLSAWVQMLGAKAFWAFYRIYIPLTMFNIEASTFWGVFFLAEFMTGWYLAFNFQVSHVSTECDYPLGDQTGPQVNDEWAISQVKTSVDYAHGSPLVAFFSGALNYQVTHHLFPGISQYHYPAIAPIIMEVCKKYKIKYTVLPTFREALGAHFQHLKDMGKLGKPLSMEVEASGDESNSVQNDDNLQGDVKNKANTYSIQSSFEFSTYKWNLDISQLALSTNLTLEKFYIRKWQEIHHLSKCIRSRIFKRVRLAGDNRALYENFFRSFPHELVSKARFVGVMRAIYGIEEEVGFKSKLSHDEIDLCRRLETMQYTYELSDGNVLMLNWRLLLFSLRLFEAPLTSLRQHFGWGFRVFASNGFFDPLEETTKIRTTDVILMLSHLMRNQVTQQLISDRFRQAQIMHSSTMGTSMHKQMTYISFRHFERLLQSPPLAPFFERATDYTLHLDEVTSPIYRDVVFRARKNDMDRQKIERLQYYHRTRIIRRVYGLWVELTHIQQRTRVYIANACARIAHVKKAYGFHQLRQYAIQNWAALEIQRYVRGMMGRKRAYEQWRLIQSVLKVQGAFRMRSHFIKFIKTMQTRHRIAISIQRIYRGRLGRKLARQRLLERYYHELTILQQERAIFQQHIRDDMAIRLQRLFQRIVKKAQIHRNRVEQQERIRIVNEMEKMASIALDQVQHYKQEITAKYDTLRHDTLYQKQRQLHDNLEKEKIKHLRRQREWDGFKRQCFEKKQQYKQQEHESYEKLETEWKQRIQERIQEKQSFLSQLISMEDAGELKSLQKELQLMIKLREKELNLLYKHSNVPKHEIETRATLEIIQQQVEKERQIVDSEWLQAEADFLDQVEKKEQERMIQEQSEIRRRREQCAVKIQSIMRMFAARKRLQKEIYNCYIKEYHIESQLPLYCNKYTGQSSFQKPYGLGKYQDLEYQDYWVLIPDPIIKQSFFYHPKEMIQCWDKPKACECCISPFLNVHDTWVFASYCNPTVQDFLCQSCYDRLQTGEVRTDGKSFEKDNYYPYDGAKGH